MNPKDYGLNSSMNYFDHIIPPHSTTKKDLFTMVYNIDSMLLVEIDMPT